MGEFIKNIIRKTYHSMQKHYLTFRILVKIKEMGITRKVNSWILRSSDEELRKNPSADMIASRKFYEDNKERIKQMLSLLADEKSRQVWGGVMQYRMRRTPLKPEWYSENDQYFVEDIIKMEEGEVFIDGGAYTGDTIQQFMDLSKKKKKKYRRIIAFEPDKINFQLAGEFFSQKNDVVLINKGLADEEKELVFSGSGATARIAEIMSDETTVVPVVNIDAVPECRDATWIKMDIEGAEMDALRGAEKVIKKNRPKLTICIYHSDEDMVRIAEYIHQLVPEYRLYVRHHSRSKVETVLYAVR